MSIFADQLFTNAPKRSSASEKLSHGQVLKTYKVALGVDPVGPKLKAGDKKTAEGEYITDSKNPHSRFHLAPHISYPNPADSERARKLGVSPGGGVGRTARSFFRLPRQSDEFSDTTPHVT